MKKWLRRILIAAVLVGLTLGILYECATHVGRGWLFGEAFYEGRPTSYWRSQIDRWIARHDSPKEAEESMNWLRLRVHAGVELSWSPGEEEVLIQVDNDGREMCKARLKRTAPPPTIWERLRNALQPGAVANREPPNVLSAMSDAEPVLRELDAEARFHAFTKRARRNTAILAEYAKPAAP
jgi:hypothetical protein